MARVCPHWLTYTFDNPLRRLVHDASEMAARFVEPGMRVADIGCGMGYFTVALAARVGPSGWVQAVDLQPAQLAKVRQRAARAGVISRVMLVEATPDDLRLAPPLDFILAFWMVHEVDDQARFFAQVCTALRPGGRVLVVEPKIHVPGPAFVRTLDIASSAGFTAEPASVRLSRAALLRLGRST